MSDDLESGLTPSVSEQDVERARRVALSRLDELETSFHRVSERLVSVERRLGELSEDLRVRVTALQQQTREAVEASRAAPEREPVDLAASLEDIRAVIRADVQEIGASIRTTFAEVERRLLEGQAGFLERADASGHAVHGSIDELRQAVEGLGQQVAAGSGMAEVRTAVDALRAQVEAVGGTDELRSALEALRADVTSAGRADEVLGSIETLRAEVAAAGRADELKPALEALRSDVAAAGRTDDLLASLESLRSDVGTASSSQLEQLRADLVALRQEIAAIRPADPLPAVDSLRQEVVGQIEQLRAGLGGASDPEVGQRLASLHEELGALGQSVRESVSRLADVASQTAPPSHEGLEVAVASLQEKADAVVQRAEAMEERSSTMSSAQLGVVHEQLAELRLKVEEMVDAAAGRTDAPVERVQEQVEGWMARFRELLDASLTALQQPPPVETGAEVAEVRAEMAATGRDMQERLDRLERAVRDLGDRLPQAPPPMMEPPPPPPPAPDHPVEQLAADPGAGIPVYDERTVTSGEPVSQEEAAAADTEAFPVEEEAGSPPDAEAAAPAEADETPTDQEERPEVAEVPQEQAPEEEEPSEEQPGSKRLPDIWSWGPKQG